MSYYIFSVDTTNLKKCLDNLLFGVPYSSRAFNQIFPIKKGDFLFLYEYGAKRIHGIYKAKSDPFYEPDASRGPWGNRVRDKKAKHYPYRLEIEVCEYYPNGVSIGDIEKKRIGIDRHSFNGKSCLYITDYQAEKILELLKNQKSEEFHGIPWKSNVRPLAQNPPIKDGKLEGKPEDKLQLLVLENLKSLHNAGLPLKVLDCYYNVTECMSCQAWCGTLDYAGQIDILGADEEENFIVVELKAGQLQISAVEQVRKYTESIKKSIANKLGVSVLPAIICKDASPKLARVLESKKIKAFKYSGEDFEHLSIDFEPLT
jgi:hypothetical protein